MNGYIGHTDRGWWRFLAARPELQEVNFWRPGGRRFSALHAGEPFFFRLKSPINKIGGFGLFARDARLPAWRAWEVFETANGVNDERQFLRRLERLIKRPVNRNSAVGCIAVTECIFFDEDDLVDVPSTFNPQNLSGSVIDLGSASGKSLWAACLDRAAVRKSAPSWTVEALDRQRAGKSQVIVSRLGQGSFRLAVLDAYGGSCAVTGEHALPALEAAHIRPWSAGGEHRLDNGLPMWRDLHRLFDLGYVSARPDGRFIVSPRLKSEFANGRTYYELAGRSLRLPAAESARPAADLLRWHSDVIFQST